MPTSQRPRSKRQPHDLSRTSFAFFGTFAFWPSYHPGPPAETARRFGATVRTTVDEDLDYLVLGDRRGTGRAEAKKKAEKLRAKAEKAATAKKTSLRPTIIDEAAFREMVRADLSGKRFAFFGGFDCCPSGLDDRLLKLAAETFLQYKGAEAGEIDWRPTETIPEDFYAY